MSPTSQPPKSCDGARPGDVVSDMGPFSRLLAAGGLPSRSDVTRFERSQFSKRLPTLPTFSLVTNCARVSRLAAEMPRSICR